MRIMSASSILLKHVFHSKKNVKSFFAFFLIYSVSSVVSADSSATFSEEESLNKKLSMQDVSMLGDTYDPSSGSVSFAVTDIAIPGNSDLKVELRRKYAVSRDSADGLSWWGSWFLDIPSIRGYYLKQGNGTVTVEGDGWHNGKVCTGDVAFRITASSFSGQGWEYPKPESYWQGKFLNIPAEEAGIFLQGKGGFIGKQITRANYYISSCFQRPDGMGEGIVVSSPDGKKYTFGYSIDVESRVGPSTAYRYKKTMLVTKVEDKFGNYVSYNYTGNELTSIVASDGRKITLSYDSSAKVGTVTANGRMWKYYVDATTGRLSEVVLPDMRKWKYSAAFYQQTSAITHVYNTVTAPQGYCEKSAFGSTAVRSPISFSVTTPDNIKVDYQLADIYQGKYKTPIIELPSFRNFMLAMYNCSVTQSLVSKTVSGPGLANQNWQYLYSENKGTYGGLLPSGSSVTFLYGRPASVSNEYSVKTVTVKGPDKHQIFYIDRNAVSTSEGKTLAVDTIDPVGNRILHRLEEYYSPITSDTFVGAQWDLVGAEIREYDKSVIRLVGNSDSVENRINKQKTIEYFFNSNGTDSFTKEYLSYDLYGWVGQIKESNNFSTKERYTKFDYLNHVENWTLGLPKATSVSQYLSGSYTEISRADYIGKTVAGLYTNVQVVDKTYSYGFLDSYFKEYHNDGNIKRIEYANANRWVDYSNYKRGQAQTITTPSSITATPQYTYKVIDDNGWLKKVTDPKGNVTNYDYNAIGLLKDIIPGNSFWTPTKLEYLATTGSEGVTGVVAGMLQQRITKGNYRKNVYYDALLRPIVSSEEDLSNSATRRFINRKFNINNKLTFDAYPSSAANSTTGVTYVYDGLSRKITETRDTANGKVSAFTEYWSGNRIYTKDYKANATTTEFLAYGEPEYSNPLTISSPEGVITSLNYNIFGNPTSISQGGVTQYNVYDSAQQRCKEIRPDIGNTAFRYNITGEIDWLAQSTSVSSSTTECDYDVDAADKIIQDYDNFGAIKTVTYGDGTSTKSYTYDKNGNLELLTFGTLTQNYSYDDRNNLTGEKHTSDGQVRSFTYKYNALSNLSDVIYPNNHSIAFSPNALGQAAYVYNSTAGYYYAKNVLYYPSGTVDSYTYGNNLVYKLTQNTQLLPRSIEFKNASNTLLSGFVYSYDNNSNIDGIVDSQSSAFNVSMTYDGLDRLKTATGNWGSGIFNYDLMGNITSYSLGGFGLTYTYNTNKQLTDVTGGKAYNFSYDERYNVTRNTSSGVSMIYNLENQMVSAGSTSYTYDGYNRRIKKQSPAGRELFMYSKAGVLMFSEKSNGVKTNYIYLGNNLIAKDDSTASQSSSSSTPAVIPTISSASVSNAYSPWRVSIQGSNLTSGSKITVFDNGGSQWANNISVIFTNSSSVAFSLPSNLAPSKCNLTSACLITFRLTTENGSTVDSSVSLPAVSAPISISGYSLSQASSPWRVNLSGTNFTAGSSVTLFDSNGAQWATNVAISFASTSSISFNLPSNSPPSQCNKTVSCNVKARVINEHGVLADVTIALPALPAATPPSISQIGLAESYNPWAMWVTGANFTTQSYVTLLDTNKSIWRANIPVTSSNTTSFTFTLPSNTVPSGCNLTSWCTIYLKATNNAGQSSAEVAFSLRPVNPPAPTVSLAGVNTDYSPWAVWVNGTNYLASSTITLIDQNGSVWKSGISVAFMNTGYITFGMPANSPPSGCNATTTCVIKMRVVNPDQRYAEYSLTLPKR